MMDYYQVLGVSKTATAEEIKRAYRKLASKMHPDKGGTKEEFQNIQTAYETLSDPQRRQNYDVYGNQSAPRGPQMGPGGFHFEFGNGGFEDIFSVFGINRTRQNRKQTYSAVVFVSLDEAAIGVKKTIQLNFPQGQQIISVDVPHGVDDGESVNYENLIPNATLVIQYRILAHSKYQRRGLDLYSTLSINVFELITGRLVTLTDIYGKELELTVNPRTKIGTTLRCVGHGLDTPRGVGDLYVSLISHIPDTISDELLAAINKEVKGN